MLDDIRFTPSDLEFAAEFEPIVIEPKFQLPEISLLLNQHIGPFRNGQPATVPLWVAIMFSERGKCSITLPDWLTIESLKRVLDEEKHLPTQLTRMPPYYVEIGTLLTRLSQETFDNQVETIQRHLEDLIQLRRKKIDTSLLHAVDFSVQSLDVTHLARGEIQYVRDQTTGLLDNFLLCKDLEGKGAQERADILRST